MERLTEKQVEFVSRKEAIDTTTPTGKFMLTVFVAVAELEREYILQRQREGIAIAKERGKYTGRRPQPLPDNFERVVARWRAGEITAVEAMRQTGLKPNTFAGAPGLLCAQNPHNTTAGALIIERPGYLYAEKFIFYLLISQKRMRIAATSARVALFCGFSLPLEPLTMPLATAQCIAFSA